MTIASLHDPELVLAIGRLAQARGVSEIRECLAMVAPSLTSANRVDLSVADKIGSIACAAIDRGTRVVAQRAALSSSSNDSLYGPDVIALAAWSVGTGQDDRLAITASWINPNVAISDDVATLDALACMVKEALARTRQWHELEALTESRTRSVQAVNEELETFAYTTSHDLKTPLTVIKTSIWTVRQLLKDQLDERVGPAIDRLESMVERMRGQVDGMLQMYRLTKNTLSPEVVNVSALCQDCLDELQATDTNRSLQRIIQPNLEVRGDPTLLRVVVRNLLDNAWKYTGKVPNARIEVGSHGDSKDGLVISIRDNGAGFDWEKAEDLFGVFQRFHTDDEFEGSGIGLASVQRIINKHGGRVWAQSEVGRGATFYFSLPEELPTDELLIETSLANGNLNRSHEILN